MLVAAGGLLCWSWPINARVAAEFIRKHADENICANTGWTKTDKYIICKWCTKIIVGFGFLLLQRKLLGGSQARIHYTDKYNC